MPPKPKSPSKGKKGKLSKAEKERLKKEELDRKEKEEEDARLKAEQEEKERLERERLEREERERIEAAESQRYTAESAELESVLEGNRNALATLVEDQKQNSQWSRFMQCDGSPDPTVTAEINTYINLWMEDGSRSDLKSLLTESKLTLKLIGELQGYLETADDLSLTEEQILRYEETISELENLLNAKQDVATFELLKGATYQADSESGNLQLVDGNGSMVLMIWGNLTKNPRFKTFEFEESKLSFELPKQLALQDIAVRFIQMKYDHYSHQCRTFALKRKKKKPSLLEVSEPPPPEMEQQQTQDGENQDQEETEEDGGENKIEDGAEEEDKEEEEKKDEDAVEGQEAGKNSEDAKDEVAPEKADAAEEGKGGDEADEDEEEEEEMNEFEDEDTVDLRAYEVLGGVLAFDLLALPPQPKQVKGWIMTQVTSSELQRVPYPVGDPAKMGQTLSGTVTMGITLDPKAVANAAAAAEALGAPAVGVKFKLADNVLFSEEPQLVYWSEQGRHWRLDGFTDINFDEVEKTLSFKTINFGKLACIQDKHINMPFQSWELKPLGTNHAKLTIIAAILEVEIQIKDHLCCFNLSAESDPKPELSEIVNKWMPPQELVKSMRAAGVNVFPARDSKKYVTITEKDEDTEETIYRQMALTASVFAYSWSKWNSEASAEKIVMLGAEKLDGSHVNEDDWSLLLMRKDRCFKLKMKEQDEEFSEVHAEGNQFHADLYHMVSELSSEAGRERMSSHFRFVDAVNQVLTATKILTYS